MITVVPRPSDYLLADFHPEGRVLLWPTHPCCWVVCGGNEMSEVSTWRRDTTWFRAGCGPGGAGPDGGVPGEGGP